VGWRSDSHAARGADFGSWGGRRRADAVVALSARLGLAPTIHWPGVILLRTDNERTGHQSLWPHHFTGIRYFSFPARSKSKHRDA
jgi:hypothetical protein